MELRAIVCGVDDSDGSRVAARIASAIAQRLGDRLIIAHVADMSLSPESYGGFFGLPGVDTLALQETSAQSAHELVEAIVADEHLLDAEQRVSFGLPAEQLAEIAEDENAELNCCGLSWSGATRRRRSLAAFRTR